MGTKQLCIAISGGGALGIGPLAFMCRLEQDLGKKLCEMSVAFAGTSTGSIIAGGLDEGYSAHELFDLYRNNLKKIFTKYPWYKRAMPTCPTYDNSNLKEILKSKFTGKISKWTKPIFIPVTFMNGESVEKVWDLGDKEVDKWFAILTSCSAPTYFDVVEKDGDSYCDGGLWANSNADVLLAGQFKQGHRDIKILNFGTGLDTPNTEKGNKTLAGWAKYMLSDWIARSSKSPIYETKSILGDRYVFDACPKYKKSLEMDDVSDKNIELVIKIWEDYYEAVKKEVLDFVKNR